MSSLYSFLQCRVTFILLGPSILLSALSSSTSIYVFPLISGIKTRAGYNLFNKNRHIKCFYKTLYKQIFSS
jgi:hypothetical protein